MPATKVSTMRPLGQNLGKKRQQAAISLEKARAAKSHRRVSPLPATPEPELSPQPSSSSASFLSASSRKLSSFQDAPPAPDASPLKQSTTIVQLDCLQELFTGLLCPSCLTPIFAKRQGSSQTGLSVQLQAVCRSCSVVLNSTNTSPKMGKVFEVNRCVVASSLANGSGPAALLSFCEMMDMPPMHHKTFQRHQKAIQRQASFFSSGILKESVQIVRDAYPEQAGKDVIDIDVSYDGSWQIRGHKSMCGIGCIIENRTGLVVDYDVFSKYCHICAVAKEKWKDDVVKLEEFLANHACDKNHLGSSGSMEQVAAVNMWKRSVEKNGLRYRTFISDGDANTLKQLLSADPYDDLKIEKRECVNHVGKRMGKALRTKVDNKRKVKVTLGGNGKGKLTQVKMAKLQKYYTKAIRSNSTDDSMRKAIWASFNHCSSTYDKPRHQDCPAGVDSWCFFQRAAAKGLPAPDHDKHYLLTCPFVADHIRDVYEHLSGDDLLSRCVGGMTQNGLAALSMCLLVGDV